MHELAPVKYFCDGIKRIIDASEPDMLAWWAQQPINLFQDRIEDFEEFIEKNQDWDSQKIMAKSILSDLEIYSDFQRKISRHVDALEKFNHAQEIHWRLKSAKDPSKTIGNTVRSLMLEMGEAKNG